MIAFSDREHMIDLSPAKLQIFNVSGISNNLSISEITRV